MCYHLTSSIYDSWAVSILHAHTLIALRTDHDFRIFADDGDGEQQSNIN